MDILELMKADHDEVADLFDELDDVADSDDAEDAAQAASLVNKLGQAIFLHAKSEEVALYEACKEKTQKVREFALQGFQEHDLLTRQVQKLATMTPGPDGEFKAGLEVANELFKHHARLEEERGAFPKLRRAFNQTARNEMAQRMLAEKRRLMEGTTAATEENQPAP
jgi:hypothetical protein